MFTRFLPAAARGIIVLLFSILWLIVLCFIVFPVGLVRYLLPVASWRHRCEWLLNQMPVLWADGVGLFMRLFTKLQVELVGADDLPKKEWYLMTANHQAWADILILFRVFNHKIPVLKFFIKSQMLWMPFFGWACWLIGYPFMKRYTKEQVAKKPSLKGADLAATRKACKRFCHTPMSIISFAEGTRYTKEKAKRQQTPYKHLLKPRAGGLAFTLAAMSGSLHRFVDVTIFYPGEKLTFWDYVTGRITRVVVHVESYPIKEELLGDYANDREYRVRFQAWLNDLWQRKDDKLEALHQKYRSDS